MLLERQKSQNLLDFIKVSLLRHWKANFHGWTAEQEDCIYYHYSCVQELFDLMEDLNGKSYSYEDVERELKECLSTHGIVLSKAWGTWMDVYYVNFAEQVRENVVRKELVKNEELPF